MQCYLDLLQDILHNGVPRKGRNGNTISLFGTQLRFNLREGFPAVTTKKLAFRAVKAELLGFLRGYTHAEQFEALGANIWTANAEAWGRDGELGRIYGVQWREWQTLEGSIDQLDNVISQIQTNPYSRRLVVSAWNPSELDEMALPPCHVFFQFYVADGTLSLQMYQRSADMFLGVPFNIASYALLLSMVSQVTNLTPKELILTFGDAHIYEAHLSQVKQQLLRVPRPLPILVLNPNVKSIDNFKMQDILLTNYHHHDSITAPMVV